MMRAMKATVYTLWGWVRVSMGYSVRGELRNADRDEEGDQDGVADYAEYELFEELEVELDVAEVVFS